MGKPGAPPRRAEARRGGWKILAAAFLSVRREFLGRPDELKRILLHNCTTLDRDRYHQGAGMPNLVKMLANT